MKTYNEIKSEIIKGNLSVNYQNSDDYNRSALHYAILNGDIEFINYLISREAHIDIIDDEGKTPVSYIILFQNNNENKINFKMLDIFLKNRANINNIDKNGNSCIFYGINGDIELIKLLIKNGIDLFIINKNGESICDLCVLENKKELAKVFNNLGSRFLKSRQLYVSQNDYKTSNFPSFFYKKNNVQVDNIKNNKKETDQYGEVEKFYCDG